MNSTCFDERQSLFDAVRVYGTHGIRRKRTAVEDARGVKLTVDAQRRAVDHSDVGQRRQGGAVGNK